jgi:hypothetical protein
MKDQIEKSLIDISLKIAKQGKGCLFVILETKLDYENLIEQDVKSFNIFENQRRLEALALLDGACIIDLKGNLIAYSAHIKNTKTFKGYGTRHAAAHTSSLAGNLTILASEEDKKVKIWKAGQMVMQLGPLEKDIQKKIVEAVTILESVGAGSLAVLGTSILMPTLGITIIPGIIIFGSLHFITKMLWSKQ